MTEYREDERQDDDTARQHRRELEAEHDGDETPLEVDEYHAYD